MTTPNDAQPRPRTSTLAPLSAWQAAQADTADDVAAEARAAGRPVYRSAAAYLAVHPEGACHLWPSRTTRPLALLPVHHDHRQAHLPGGYLLAMVLTTAERGVWVDVFDNDDGVLQRSCATQAEAASLLDDLAGLGPVDFADLVEAWGFVYG